MVYTVRRPVATIDAEELGTRAFLHRQRRLGGEIPANAGDRHSTAPWSTP
jgi:hypothetical protein